MTDLTLSDLVDLELRCVKEEGENEGFLRSAYRDHGKALLEAEGVSRNDPAALLKGFLRRTRSGRTAGEKFASTVGWIHATLILAGAVLGGGLAVELLRARAEHPVNILFFLAAMVGIQIVLLIALVTSLIPWRRKTGFPSAVPLRRLFRWIVRDEEIRDLLENPGRRPPGIRGLERWLLLRATQVFGVSFNLAALAGCLYRISFSDVTFGWSTTLQWAAADFHAIVQALSTPWAWLVSDARPSLELVEMTRYSHFEGKYILRAAGERSLDVSAVGGWWPFLLLSLATYGLLPRLGILVLSTVQVKRMLRRATLVTERLRRRVAWMTDPLVEVRPDGPDPVLPPGPAERAIPDEALPSGGTECAVVVCEGITMDRETMNELVGKRFGWKVAGVVQPQDVMRGAAWEGTNSPVVVVTPAWEEPIKTYQRFFKSLRRSAGSERMIVVALMGKGVAPVQEVRLRWKRHLQDALEDARLRVEILGVGG